MFATERFLSKVKLLDNLPFFLLLLLVAILIEDPSLILFSVALTLIGSFSSWDAMRQNSCVCCIFLLLLLHHHDGTTLVVVGGIGIVLPSTIITLIYYC